MKDDGHFIDDPLVVVNTKPEFDDLGLRDNLYLVTKSREDEEGVPPCKGAKKVYVHDYASYKKFGNMDWFYKNYDVLEEDEDSVSGVDKRPHEAWLCEIKDFRAFVKEYGPVIIFKPECKEGYWQVEIYNDYRE